ncbi:MAG: RagB/SusD family nutrient uptake outer membrane protein, partial [Desulfobacterales bacterium]|nr:RagB/SusD family nutrient uptake outer membrane protein [Desulfobacterales bacterium]
DLEIYVNQFYPSLRSIGIMGNIWHGSYSMDNNSDYSIPTVPNSRMQGERTIPASASQNGWNFSPIRSLNYFLTNYQTVEDPWDITKQFVGEAHFFKAFYYFDLLRRFGDVPWLSEPLETDSEELFMERTPRSAVADSIIANLDKAIDYLSWRDVTPQSRINKESALIFKSRVCLFEGTWEKYHDGTPFGVSNANPDKYLTLAADAANMLMESGKCDIFNTGNPEADYASLFTQNNYGSHSEVVLWESYDFDLGIAHRLPSREGLDMGLARSFIDSYLCTDGLPIANSPLYLGDDNLTNVVANRDLRLRQSIWVPGEGLTILSNGDTIFFTKPDIDKTTSRNTTGYQLKKGFYLEMGADEIQDSETGNVMLRYAEALLNYAEAKAELGSITQEDIDKTVNKLRSRAGMPNLQLNNIAVDPNWQFPALSPVINEIRRERGIELIIEGHRLNDLLRWRAHDVFVGKYPKGAKFIQSDFPDMVIGVNIFVDENGYIDPYQKALTAGFGFKSNRDYLDPIPAAELTLSEKLVQNPGWGN